MVRTALVSLSLLSLSACSPALVNFDKGGSDSASGDSATGPLPILSLSATALDLGYAAPEATISATLVAQNVGTSPLDLGGVIGAGGPDFKLDFTSASLDPSAEVTLTVSFSAADLGDYSGSLDLTSSDPTQPTVSIPLTAIVAADADGDGYAAGTGPNADCDDTNPSINPGATEIWYDGIDENCDGLSDYDQDGDGYNAELAPDGTGTDCNDLDATINPGADEVWYDGVDQNCDGLSDYDQDADGHDITTNPDGTGDDCDDTNAAVYPGQTEVAGNGIDDNCNGQVDETLSAVDADGDGYSEATGDCNDGDASINPGATDTWYDGIDSDCKGNDDYDQDGDGYDSPLNPDGTGTDCNDVDRTIHPGATDAWYDGVDKDCAGNDDYDADGDGYDSPTDPSGLGTDCNDADATIHPGAAEIWYDGVDEDCSGGSDYDQDGDGQKSSAYAGTDCDDTNASVYKGATETWYDGIDENCDGLSDYDQDADGYDISSDPDGTGTDCDDTNKNAHPGATEIWYDGVDEDCSGGSDYDKDADGYDVTTDPDGAGTDCNDANSAINPGAAEIWYDGVDEDCSGGSDYDQDGDGQKSSAYAGADCDDTNAAVYVGATEVCDGVDNNCNGTIDEGAPTWYRDADGDTYGNATVSETSCTASGGYVADDTDCDDSNAAIHPGATEVSYDGLDNDCDGATDNMKAETEAGWTVIGNAASEAIGAQAAVLFSDEQGDGRDELVIPAPMDGTAGTKAGALAWHDTTTEGLNVNVAKAYLFIEGDAAGDTFGYGTTSLGDVDHRDSGETEFATGAPNNDGGATDGGAVYIYDLYGYSWATGNQAVADLTQATLVGTSDSEYFGSAATEADFDSDGYDDLVVGAPGIKSGKGDVYVYAAAEDSPYWGSDLDDSDATWWLRGFAINDAFGTAVATGDVTGDGVPDLAVCSPGYDASSTTTSAGGCSVVDLGDVAAYTDTSASTVATATVYSTTSGDAMGSTANAVALADIDGDGLADLAVGVPGYDRTTTDGGAVAIYFGSGLSGRLPLAAADTRVTGDGALGTSLTLGSIDGSTDVGLIAGAPTAGTSGKGVVYVVSAKVLQGGGTVELPASQYGSWTGSVASDGFGSAISNLDDIDGDGTDDVVGGASGWDNGTTSGVGKDYVLPLW